MGKPFVVIVGRPNVGKSTLFNRITGTHSAIVEDIPGVTRDRNYLDASWGGKDFMLVDTGGFYIDPPEDIFAQAKEQALFAIDEGDIIIHLLDGREGLTPADIELARLLRSSGKIVLWVVNKIDAYSRHDRLYDFFAIGANELYPLSAATGYGFEDFMDRLSEILPDYTEEKIDIPKIAVVGRPNVGKSTLVNALTGRSRMVVSPFAGTTRDAVDSVCSFHGKKYLIIDTAGLRKKGKIGYSIERFSMVRAVRSIERCDVALVVIDGSEGITEQDVKIAGMVKDYNKGVIFLLNKWDLIPEPEKVFKGIMPELYRKMWFYDHAPAITISGVSKKRITKVFPVIDEIISKRRRRIATGELNRFFREFLSKLAIPQYKGKTVKIYYMTQVGIEPPTFVVFANYKEAVKDSQVRFIERKLREQFGFEGTPLKIFVRSRRGDSV